MKFDLSRFKKVSSDKKSTTLQHPDGHQITVAHGALNPKMRAKLVALPMAEGGAVGSTGFPKMEVQKGKFDKDASANQKELYDKSKLQMYAKGTPDHTIKREITPENVQGMRMAEMEASRRINPPVKDTQMPRKHVEPMEDMGPAVSAESQVPESQEAEDWQKHAKAQGFADGGEVDEKAPVVINIGGQGEAPQIPSQMLNPNPGAQAQAQANAPQVMDPARQAAMNPGDLPFGVTPDMIAQAPQGAPQDPNRAPTSAMSMQLPPQTAQGSPDGLKPVAPGNTPAAPADPFGTRASSEAYEAGLGTQMGGMAQEAKATGALGQAEAAIAQQAAAREQKALSIFQQANEGAMKMAQGALEAYKAGHINPNHYMESMSTAGKIGTVIGLVGAGFGGPENVRHAVDNINRQIDRDVKAQMDTLDQKKSVFDGYMKQLGNIRDAADMTRVFNTNIYAEQLKAAAAKSQDPLAQARLLTASGQLVQQASDRLGQYAMRKALENGVSQGIIPPEHIIRAIVPKEEQAAATKELKEAQEGFKAKDNALSAFDQVAKLQGVGNRALSPLQSKRQIAAITGPIVAQLSKATAGRFTEQDAEMLAPLFPQFGDDEETKSVKRQRMNTLISEKLHFPELKKWNIDPSASTRYDEGGQSRIPTSAPVRRR